MAVTFKEATLGNGLTVIAEVDPHAHTSAAGFFVKTGARDEAPGVMGVSHFLEHMMFKGTEKRSADDVNREFDEIGADYNAYTSHEMTVFYASVLPERLESAVDILADIMRPALRQDDFDTEKNVILEEIAMYKDHPFFVLYEHVMDMHYRPHPLGHRVLGTDETVGGLSRDAMQGYFDSRYSADNTVVSLAGNLDFDRACEWIDARTAHWARTGATRDGARPGASGGSHRLTDENISRAYMLALTPAPSVQDERRYAAMMLARVLGGTDNSRLHWALIETGLAEEAQAAFDAKDNVGDYYVYASCDPSNADEVWGIVEKEMDGLVESLTEDDLARLRNKLATAVTLAGERPGGRMQRLGRTWLNLGEYMSLDEELARINAVTLDDLRAVHEAFPFEPRTTGVLVPG